MTLRPTAAEAALLRRAEGRSSPFHWEIEFPEVFRTGESAASMHRRQPAVRGQEHDHRTACAESYLDWLKAIHDEAHGNADLVAHFFRRAFTLSAAGGTFGLIATNTIAQGDTRSTGLRWICTHGGTDLRRPPPHQMAGTGRRRRQHGSHRQTEPRP